MNDIIKQQNVIPQQEYKPTESKNKNKKQSKHINKNQEAKTNVNAVNSSQLANDFEDLEKELDELCENNYKKSKATNSLKNP